jgi:hypothetical protein
MQEPTQKGRSRRAVWVVAGILIGFVLVLALITAVEVLVGQPLATLVQGAPARQPGTSAEPARTTLGTLLRPATEQPPRATTPQPATLTVTFDLANGTTGFAATIFAQEVASGKTVTALYPAYSPPITMTVNAPGTYVFYAHLLEAPDDYRYGATGCQAGSRCEDSSLLAIDVQRGGKYEVYIADRSAILPTPREPVKVPWHK